MALATNTALVLPKGFSSLSQVQVETSSKRASAVLQSTGDDTPSFTTSIASTSFGATTEADAERKQVRVVEAANNSVRRFKSNDS